VGRAYAACWRESGSPSQQFCKFSFAGVCCDAGEDVGQPRLDLHGVDVPPNDAHLISAARSQRNTYRALLSSRNLANAMRTASALLVRIDLDLARLAAAEAGPQRIPAGPADGLGIVAYGCVNGVPAS
jgi:hypothetical protein